jgi:hypothetical protein
MRRVADGSSKLTVWIGIGMIRRAEAARSGDHGENPLSADTLTAKNGMRTLCGSFWERTPP